MDGYTYFLFLYQSPNMVKIMSTIRAAITPIPICNMTKKEHGIISSTEHFFLTAIPNLVKDAMNSAPICRYLKLHPHESE